MLHNQWVDIIFHWYYFPGRIQSKPYHLDCKLEEIIQTMSNPTLAKPMHIWNEQTYLSHCVFAFHTVSPQT